MSDYQPPPPPAPEIKPPSYSEYEEMSDLPEEEEKVFRRFVRSVAEDYGFPLPNWMPDIKDA